MQYPESATLDALGHSGGCLFHGGLKGLEKESLRVGPDGRLADTPHPERLGSTLTHPFITTDYAEVLLEFITPPQADARTALDFLHDVQRFAYANMNDELLWATSMPCRRGREEDIHSALYCSSKVGRMKHV